MDDDKKAESKVIASGPGSIRMRLGLKQKLSFTWLISIAAVLVIIIGAVVYFGNKSQTVFTIQGKDYSASDINTIAQFPVKTLNVNQNTEYKYIFQMMEALAVAKELGITLTPAEISTQQQAINQSYSHYLNKPGYKQWSNLSAQKAALNNLLTTQYGSGDYQGYSFIFWFGNLLTASPTYSPPNVGNQTLIAQDKAYAKQQADSFYTQLTSHKATPDQVLAAVTSDNKLAFDYTAVQGNNYSVHFGLDPTQAWSDQVYYTDVQNWILTQKNPVISTVMTGQIETDPSANTYADAYYYIVELDKVGFSPTAFNNDLNSLPAKFYGVKS